MASSACFARFEIVAGALQFRSFSMLKYPMFGGRPPFKLIWRRRLVSPVAKGCEPGQVRKEAAAASESGAGVRLAGAVSSTTRSRQSMLRTAMVYLSSVRNP